MIKLKEKRRDFQPWVLTSWKFAIETKSSKQKKTFFYSSNEIHIKLSDFKNAMHIGLFFYSELLASSKAFHIYSISKIEKSFKNKLTNLNKKENFILQNFHLRDYLCLSHFYPLISHFIKDLLETFLL
jgi:hypothetical protein